MTIDEAIEQFKYDAECNRADLDLSFAEDNDKVAEWLEELKQYRAIGTLEECLAAVDKLRAKNPIIKYKQTHDCVTEIEWKCPVCGTNYVELAPCGEWCRYCGTKWDWRDEE